MSRTTNKEAQPTAADVHRVKLVLSGKRESLKRAAREQLEQAGWADELRQLCREHAAEIGSKELTHESLVTSVRAQTFTKVPDHLKAELLGKIKTILESQPTAE